MSHSEDHECWIPNISQNCAENDQFLPRILENFDLVCHLLLAQVEVWYMRKPLDSYRNIRDDCQFHASHYIDIDDVSTTDFLAVTFLNDESLFPIDAQALSPLDAMERTSRATERISPRQKQYHWSTNVTKKTSFTEWKKHLAHRYTIPMRTKWSSSLLLNIFIIP